MNTQKKGYPAGPQVCQDNELTHYVQTGEVKQIEVVTPFVIAI